MATIKPFRALRPDPFLAHELVFPGNEQIFYLGIDQKMLPLKPLKDQLEMPARRKPETEEGQQLAYEEIKENISKLIELERISQDEEPGMYVYEIIHRDYRQCGIWALTSINDYRKGHIKIHEHTLADSERRICNYRKNTGLEGSPILLTYKPQMAINRIIAETIASQKKSTVGNKKSLHCLWKIQNPESIKELIAAFNLNPGSPNSPWQNSYINSIFTVNSVIEGLNSSTDLTPAVKKQLLGEAKFIRAFNYFYLVNLYGNVPLVTTTDYKANELLPRAPRVQVYAQIITDLKEAQSLLTDGYVYGDAVTNTPERTRPNKWAATALLARTYLYLGDLTHDASNYALAETQASSVINNTTLYALQPLNSVFLANSQEAIWQLQPVIVGRNTPDAWTFIIPSTGPDGDHEVSLNPVLLNAFEPGDQRKVNWVNGVTITGTTYYFPYKYKSATPGANVTEYEMILRLGELYLVRAEAEAEQGETTALADLNLIRQRAGLGDYTGPTDKASLLKAILHERQVELFTEMGHRWLDLKRTGNIDGVMGTPGNATVSKGGSWKSYQQWLPIPPDELQYDPSLVQNTGY